MAELSAVEILLILLAGLAIAILALHLNDRIAVWRKHSQGEQEKPAGKRAVFLFGSGALIDANAAGHAMVAAADHSLTEWGDLASLLQGRFPGFPETQGGVCDHDIQTFPAKSGEDFVVLEQWETKARVTVHSFADLAEPGATAEANNIAEAPYPIWQSNLAGRVSWANAAYLKLAENLDAEWHAPGYPYLFDPGDVRISKTPIRTSLTDESCTHTYWFDVTTIQTDDGLTHYAVDANAIVNGEIAQRNFVQTLTKTFAQLSIGLAIFDRNRQLALFNPALIDLTTLPADFLSSRPSLLSFFDRMRENRMMPEPRNYSSWREQIAELVVAASDDRYTETWTLPSGVTYRVLGRPHPDGAIAFLFEDISAEISLTRRFRADLALGQSAMDSITDAMAVFSATGKLAFCNTAYRVLWECEPDTTIKEYTFQDAVLDWRRNAQKTEIWEKLRHHIFDLNPRESWSAEFRLEAGEPVTVRAVSLHGGYTSIIFVPDSQPQKANEPAEMIAS